MKPRVDYTPFELTSMIIGLLFLSAGPLAAVGIFRPDLAEQWIKAPQLLFDVLRIYGI